MSHLLFLSHNLPYPPHAGVTHRTLNVLKQLGQEYEITLVAFYRKAYHASLESVDESIAELSRYAHVSAHPLPGSYSRKESVVRHITSQVRGEAYTIGQYRSDSYTQAISQLAAARKYDVVHLDSIVLGGYSPQLRPLPQICVHHNVESHLLRRRAKSVGNPAISLYMHLQSRRLEALERHLCPSFSVNVMVSETDRERLTRLCPDARVEVVENGVDCEFFRPKPDVARSDEIVFVGPMSWAPNWDAMVYFLNEIWPLLRSLKPALTFNLVGKCLPHQRRLLAKHDGVNLLGRVDDIRPYLSRAGCYVVPIRVGGGTRIKILDAWAMGKAVVSTPVGCEGLEYTDGKDILVRSNAKEFAQAVSSVLEDVALRRRLEVEARKLALRRYDWRVLGQHMRSLYREVSQGAEPSSPAANTSGAAGAAPRAGTQGHAVPGPFRR